MPTSNHRRDIEFQFKYEDADYYFDGLNIETEEGLFICRCDITAFDMEYNEKNLRICCKLRLDAYFTGYSAGKRAKLSEIQQVLGIR